MAKKNVDRKRLETLRKKKVQKRAKKKTVIKKVKKKGKILIAEIGNNHCGDYQKCLELINAAIGSGADMIKLQAFVAENLTTGSMPVEFYKKCQFNLRQLKKLIAYGHEKTIPIFCSVFDPSYFKIFDYQKYRKVTGNQARDIQKEHVPYLDTAETIISIPADATIPKFKKAHLLHVTDYCTNKAHLPRINYISKTFAYDRPVGLSDHTIGIKTALRAIKEYDVPMIEKHFVLKEDQNNIYYKDKLFRDSVHAANPDQFEEIARSLK